MRAATRATAIVGVALASTLVLANCAGDDGGGGGDGGSNELRIFWNTGEDPGMQAVIEAYEKENPDVEISFTSATGGTYQSMLRTELSSGTAADIVYAWSPSNAGGIRTLDAAGYLEDLSDEPWVDLYQDSFKDGVRTEDGRVLLMSILSMGFNSVYNQTALDELGLTAPETWDEMFAFCDAAVAAGRVGYTLAGAEEYGAHSTSMAIAVDLVYGDPVTGETTFQFDEDIVSGATTFPTNEGFVTAWTKLEEMYASNCFIPNLSGITNDENRRMVATGEALGSIIGTLSMGLLQDLNPDAEFLLYEFDSDNNPLTRQEILSMQGGAAIPKGGNVELAKEFVRFMADNANLYWSKHAGTAPTLTTVDVGDDPNVTFMRDIIDRGDNIPYLNTYWCAEAEAAMVAGNQGLVVGSTTPMAIMEAMQAAYDACR